MTSWCSEQNSRSKHSLSLQLPIPCLPMTPFHSTESCPTLALKSPKISSLSLESTCCRRLCKVMVEGLRFTPISACRVGAYTLRTVANILSWLGGLRGMRQSEWPVGKFCSFLAMDVLIMKQTPERWHSSLCFPDQKRVWPAPWGSLVQKKRTSLKAAILMSSWASSLATSVSLKMIFRVLHGANVPVCYFQAVKGSPYWWIPISKDSHVSGSPCQWIPMCWWISVLMGPHVDGSPYWWTM